MPMLTLNRVLPALLLACTSLLPTTALAQRALPQSSPNRPLPGASLRTLLGQRTVSPAATPVQLRTSPATVGWIQRMSIPLQGQAGPGGLTGPGAPGFTGLLYRLFVPATGYDELFSLHVPAAPQGVARPMLVGFHGFGTSHLDLYFNARELMDEAAARNWFLLAPFQINPATSDTSLSASLRDPSFSFASAESQVHVEALIDFVLAQWSVDLDRIYGIGFSMGGGNALSFAARHRDRHRGAFAAVVNHTGTVSVGDVWTNNPPTGACNPTATNDTRAKMHVTFGGPPPSFEYQRSSLVDLDPAGQLLPGGRHMAVNLAGVPVQSHYHAQDALTYLVDQTSAFHGFLSTATGGSSALLVGTAPGCPSSTCSVPNEHCWDTVDLAAACGWLSSQRLDPAPLQGELLADRDGRWGSIEVELETAGQFGALRYAVATQPSGSSTVELLDRENLQRLKLDGLAYGLDVSAGVTVRTSSVDGLPTTLVLNGITTAPFSVLRNGVPVTAPCTGATGPGWCYDAVAQEVRLLEPSASLEVWELN